MLPYTYYFYLECNYMLDNDTHNSTVQASSYRLITLLKSRYSNINIQPELQGTLIANLQSRIEPEKGLVLDQKDIEALNTAMAFG